MAIQPRFAQAILSGSKQIEFRKRALAPDVRTVLIYETAPTQRIVGEFDVVTHVVASPSGLWRRFASVAGIDAASYAAYYGDRAQAVGLTISRVRRYERGVQLSELDPAPAVPQSFAYLNGAMLADVRLRSTVEPQVEARVVSALGVDTQLVG